MEDRAQNNAVPVAEGQCCNECLSIVMPARLKTLKMVQDIEDSTDEESSTY